MGIYTITPFYGNCLRKDDEYMKVIINQEEFDTNTLPQKPYAPIAQCGREVAAEGAVLLKNDKNVLPVLPEETVSLFWPYTD